MRADRLVKLLKEKGISLGAVESFTGGMFASTVVDVPGASTAFKGSVVTYSREEKERILCIDPRIIDQYGTVSWEVASQMAIRGREFLDVDICVSFTGNAGPTAEGTAPVGVGYMAVCTKDYIWGVPLQLNGTRDQIRRQAVDVALLTVESIAQQL